MAHDNDDDKRTDMPADFDQVLGESMQRALAEEGEVGTSARAHLLSSSGISPGAVIKPKELAMVLFEKMTARKDFYQVEDNKNAWLVSRSVLSELRGVRTDTIEEALDLISEAITQSVGKSNKSFDRTPLFVSDDETAFGLVFNKNLSREEIKITLAGEEQTIRDCLKLLCMSHSRDFGVEQ